MLYCTVCTTDVLCSQVKTQVVCTTMHDLQSGPQTDNKVVCVCVSVCACVPRVCVQCACACMLSAGLTSLGWSSGVP